MQLSVTDRLESLEQEWRSFEQRADCTPFQTFEWLSAWQRCIGSRTRTKPAIVTGRQTDGRLLFILPLAIERARFGRRCVFLGRALCDYNAPLLAPEFPRVVAAADFAAWCRTVTAFVRKTREYSYDALWLDKMPERIGQQANPLLALGAKPNQNRAYRAYLGDDWESFYTRKRSSKSRQQRRSERKRLAEHGEVQAINLDNPQERQSALKLLFDQKGKALARAEVSNIYDEAGYLDFYLTVATQARTLVHVNRLDVGSTCVAVNLGLQFQGCYYGLLTSHDDGPLRRFGPGVILLHEVMRHAISQGLRYFDFAIGDHPYKLDWADEAIRLYDHLAAAGWIGLADAMEIMLEPRARQLLRKSPAVWRLARRCKSAVGSKSRRASA